MNLSLLCSEKGALEILALLWMSGNKIQPAVLGWSDEKAVPSLHRGITGQGSEAAGGLNKGFALQHLLFAASHTGDSRWRARQALECYLSQDFMLWCSVSINQSFAIKFKWLCSKPSQVTKYELINFPLICMIIKIPTFNSVNCLPTRRLIGLC